MSYKLCYIPISPESQCLDEYLVKGNFSITLQLYGEVRERVALLSIAATN